VSVDTASGAVWDDPDTQKSSHEGWNGLQNKTKPDDLSTETTKQDQTATTSSESLEPATTGGPLPCGDALVTYANAKRQKNCPGKENGSKKK
jgi:hypothetical protein